MTPGLKPFANESEHMTDAVKALNVLYVYNNSYEPYLVYWLFPLQMAFEQESGLRKSAYEFL